MIPSAQSPVNHYVTIKFTFMSRRAYIFGILFALLFFLAGFFTRTHYGINIDEPIHFIRGQAYFRLLTTGKSTYQGFESTRRSVWQIDGYGAERFMKEDVGHPPLNGILAAATNYVLYQKLGIIGDLESYHLFEVFVSSLLVYLVFHIAAKHYGVFAGSVAAISLFLYPLFLGESRFNIKDPIEAAFFAYTIYFFYEGIRQKKARLLLISSLWCGLALGTKFNIVFAPFITIPWLLFVAITEKFTIFTKKMVGALILYPIIALGMVYVFWPYLWSDPINHLMQSVSYYETIGSSPQDWSMYPIEFIFASTPEIILILSGIGGMYALFKFRNERYALSLLILLWFLIPVFRVVRPGASIYSGVRQIMEYVPAMAILSGMGGTLIVKWLNGWMVRKKIPLTILQVIIFLLFIPTAIKLVSIHPNENVYMNSFVGGLNGAMDRDLQGAGQTMGNVYLQGIWWLNDHAEEGARAALAFGGHGVIPDAYVRPDIKFGPYSSGIRRQGEYVMERISQDHPTYLFEFQVLDRFLEPVHTVVVDGVPLLKIWKNSPEYLKPGFEKELLIKNAAVSAQWDDERNERFISIEIPKPAYITRLKLQYSPDDLCSVDGTGQIFLTSSEGGEVLLPLDEDLFIFQDRYGYVEEQEKKNAWHYYFPALPMKRLRVFVVNPQSCLYNTKSVEVWWVEGR